MEYNKPSHLKLTGNIHENYKQFKQEVDVYFTATETYDKDQKVQVARLLNLIGADGLKLYNTFKLETITVSEIFKSLEEYCVPKKNEVIEHYKFFMRKQSEIETFDKCYAELRELIKTCSFKDTEDALLRTQIVLGIRDKDLQARLLREDLPLDKVVKYCQSTEQGEINRKMIIQENENKLDIVEQEKQFTTKKTMGKWQQQGTLNQQAGSGQLRKAQKSQDTGGTKFNCNKCSDVPIILY